MFVAAIQSKCHECACRVVAIVLMNGRTLVPDVLHLFEVVSALHRHYNESRDWLRPLILCMGCPLQCHIKATSHLYPGIEAEAQQGMIHEGRGLNAPSNGLDRIIKWQNRHF